MSSGSLVLLAMTTAPLLGFNRLINSLLLGSNGERFARVTVMVVQTSMGHSDHILGIIDADLVDRLQLYHVVPWAQYRSHVSRIDDQLGVVHYLG